MFFAPSSRYQSALTNCHLRKAKGVLPNASVPLDDDDIKRGAAPDIAQRPPFHIPIPGKHKRRPPSKARQFDRSPPIIHEYDN
jgi:hypothetical protein